jgi:hypothetical protein
MIRYRFSVWPVGRERAEPLSGTPRANTGSREKTNPCKAVKHEMAGILPKTEIAGLTVYSMICR